MSRIKRARDYTRLASSKAFFAELSADMGIPITDLIQTLGRSGRRRPESMCRPGEFTYFAEDVDGNEHEIVVHFSGYSDPGRSVGPVEVCYPPEGEIEIDCKLPEGVDFGDLDKLHEKIEDAAWERLHDYAEERE